MMHVGGICCDMMQVVDVVGEKVLDPQDEPSSYFIVMKKIII